MDTTAEVNFNLIGQRFGTLMVVGRTQQGHWRCNCDCGKRVVRTFGALYKTSNSSCGCKRDLAIAMPGGGSIVFQGTPSHPVDKIQSLEGFNMIWLD